MEIPSSFAHFTISNTKPDGPGTFPSSLFIQRPLPLVGSASDKLLLSRYLMQILCSKVSHNFPKQFSYLHHFLPTRHQSSLYTVLIILFAISKTSCYSLKKFFPTTICKSICKFISLYFPSLPTGNFPSLFLTF